ncbi:MAG: 6-phosphofructokinase [Candidatus Izemoplasmatales bacterium]|jgi:6-phosphofructokinase 1
MKAIQGNVLYGQSGGPTAVINASAYGVIKEALRHTDIIPEIYAMKYGIRGALNGELIQIRNQDDADLEKLPSTPGAAFGSVRYKLKDFSVDETDYCHLLAVLKHYNIRFFFLNGGNDSMDTCDKVDRYLQREGYQCQVIGIPKTIDNDLPITDHSPGYGSAAKYIANTIMEIVCDTISYPKSKVAIVEIMGRHSGWLTASSHIATHNGSGPDLIYLPEIPFNSEQFLADVKRIYTAKNRCVIAVSEGISDQEGHFLGLSSRARDDFGHAMLGGVAHSLADLVSEKLGYDTRPMELGLVQRCASHLQSKVDLQEAIMVGRVAVRRALAGDNGVMICIRRKQNDPYDVSYFTHPFADIANGEAMMPRNMINASGNGLTNAFLDYVLPLVQGEVKPKYKQGVVGFCHIK